MKKGLKKLAVLVMAGVMTIAPVMMASATSGGAAAPDVSIDYQTDFRNRLSVIFPSITDAHLDMIVYDFGEWELLDFWQRVKWANFSAIEKESWAYVCAIGQADRDWMRSNYYSDLANCDRNWCVNGGVDAAELDALIAKVTGQAAPETPAETSTPSWKQDTKGWWVERSDGSYLVNEWYQSPDSGLWYYMGADGYMLTNTTTPDGYTVNADGVWVQ